MCHRTLRVPTKAFGGHRIYSSGHRGSGTREKVQWPVIASLCVVVLENSGGDSRAF